MEGRQQGNATIKQNKTKQKQKPPTPIWVHLMGRSTHPAHCHMGRVSIQSK